MRFSVSTGHLPRWFGFGDGFKSRFMLETFDMPSRERAAEQGSPE